MTTVLSLLRHGRASGHGPEAELTAEGLAQIAALGRRLAAEGWQPARAFTSPFRRARETARVLLAEAAPAVPAVRLQELMPDTDPRVTLEALLATGLPSGRVLVVAHLPLLGLLAGLLTGDDPGFHPGTLVEIALESGGESGTLLRQLGPEPRG